MQSAQLHEYDYGFFLEVEQLLLDLSDADNLFSRAIFCILSCQPVNVFNGKLLYHAGCKCTIPPGGLTVVLYT
jgi:hypothetical protein